MSEFTKYTFAKYRENWHHRLICACLDKAVRGEPGWDSIMFMTPPRRGKTELGGRRLASYVLGRDPNARIIYGSASMTLARETSRNVRSIIQSPEYQDVFDTVLLPGQASVDLWKVTTLEAQQNPRRPQPEGSFQAVAVGTNFQGFPMDWGLIDDFSGGREEAESPRMRDKWWNWYASDFMSRAQYGCRRILTVTPWHPDDLVGRILQVEGDRWKVIRLPEYIEPGTEPPCPLDPRSEGDFLWPGFFMENGEDVEYEELVERNREHFEATRARDPYDHQAKWQVNPQSKEGKLLDDEDIKEYGDPRSLLLTFDAIAISIDCNFKKKKTADRISILVAGRRGPNIYVVDEKVMRVTFPNLVRIVKELKRKYPTALILIEEKANGNALIDTLREEVADVVGFEPGNSSKESRAQVAANRAKAGQLYAPEPRYLSTVGVWKQEIVKFGEMKFDDRMDALSQLCIHWSTQSTDLKKGWNHLFSLFDR